MILIGIQPVTLQNDQRGPEITLDADGRKLTGFGGCNQIAGSYELAGSGLRFSKMVLTRMACVRGMDLEQQLTKALESTTGWRIGDAGLEILDGAGALLARFAAK